MLKVTRWSPDTCGCILDYQWDTEIPSDLRTHTFLDPVRVCQPHSVMPDSQVASMVYEENRRKNWSLDIVHSQLPDLDLSTISWSYNEVRALEIFLGSLVSFQGRLLLQDAIDLQFGPGKIYIR